MYKKISYIEAIREGTSQAMKLDKNDMLIDGGPDKIKKQKDVWTFARKMNSDIPNWYLVKTE